MSKIPYVAFGNETLSTYRWFYKGKTGLATASTSNIAQQLVRELVHWSIQIKAGYGEHHNSR